MNQDWREIYFNKYKCKGSMIDNGFGDVIVKGTVETKTENPTIIYWAANPPKYGTSYTGSGLPYYDPIQAYDRTPNKGAVVAENRNFEFKLKFPNGYYTGLGTNYQSPRVHIRVCEKNCENKLHTIVLGYGTPFRTLTYPPPPNGAPRSGPEFYSGLENLPLRTQEQILVDSGYPQINEMPENFWGLKPPK